MRIVVTGGAGFIGSHVVDLLVQTGHEVHVIDNLSTGRRGNVCPAATFHEIDIRSAGLPDLFCRLKPDAVVHLAALIDLRRSVAEPVEDADVNVKGAVNVLWSAVKCGAKHLTFASSAAVYGAPRSYPTPEDQAGGPLSPYGASKFAFEQYLNAARHLYGLGSAVLRFANVYGPRQAANGEAGVVAIFSDLMLAGRCPVIFGDGRQTRDYIYVGDVAAAVAAAVRGSVDGVFNVSTGIETDVNGIFATLKEALDFDGDARHAAAKDGDVVRSCLDPSRASREFGWKAKFALSDGLRETARSRMTARV